MSAAQQSWDGLVARGVPLEFRPPSLPSNEVLRILPRENEDVNEEWLADKSRFACDGLKRQRLVAPMVRMPNGELQAVEWEGALIAVAKAVKAAGGQIAGISGQLADLEAQVALKDLLNRLGSEVVTTEQGFVQGGTDSRANYLLNSTIAGLEEADAVLLVGTNPRYEAPLVNTRLRKAYVHNELQIASIGPKIDLSYDHENLGADAALVKDVCSGSHAFSKVLEGAKKPAIIIGADLLERADGAAIHATVAEYCKKLKKPVSFLSFFCLASYQLNLSSCTELEPLQRAAEQRRPGGRPRCGLQGWRTGCSEVSAQGAVPAKRRCRQGYSRAAAKGLLCGLHRIAR